MIGAVCSALVLWALSGLAAPVPLDWRHGAIVVVAALAVPRDLGWVSIPMPQNARQVPQDVLQRHLLRGSLRFGFEMGTGVRTYVSSSAPYVVAIALLLAADGFVGALLTGVGFGLGRAATPIWRAVSGDGVDWDARLIGRLRFITVGACVTVTVAFAILFLRG